jgi:hypothetical protein
VPFTKTGPDTYKSPSGRKYTGKQVRLYHANDGFPKHQAKKAGKVKARGSS